jgi:hypothetical protein
MPTYIYQTIAAEGEQAETFELRQAMSDPPLARHPESGAPVQRVISGGLGLIDTTERAISLPQAGGGCGPGSCGCGKF